MDYEEQAVTSGSWSVCKTVGLHMDEKRSHVYFVANKNHPTESNLCVTSYKNPGRIRILTENGLSFKSERMETELRLNENIGFACWESSLSVSPRCSFYRLCHQSNDDLPVACLQHIIQLPSIINEKPFLTPADKAAAVPELIEYVSINSGCTHYALLLRPTRIRAGCRYPVIQVVYGGPCVQLVRNGWTAWVNFQKFTDLGYAVVIVDGRGSANRGISFESAIQNKLGTVEVEDQVEGLMEVSKRADSVLDLDRVAIMGWSYGGYMSLMCLAKKPEVYRAAIAGGAVTCWNLYDTAYTERYLGLPGDEIYKNASVLNYVKMLPDEIDRLLIVHGLIDENVHFSHTERLIEALISAGKPYSLQIFPSERHGVRSPEASEFHDASMLAFLNRALSIRSLH